MAGKEKAMPPKGFICKLERTGWQVPWDHFDNCVASRGRPGFPPWLARMTARGLQEDIRHAGIALTATRVMGCPRAALIAFTQDYWVDPRKRAAADRGTALHAEAARWLDPEVWYSEGSDPMRLVCHGFLFPQLVERLGVDDKWVFPQGLPVSTRIDALRRDLREMVNWKFGKDWAVRWRSKTGQAKPDHEVQANIERLLLAQQPWAQAAGLDPETILMTIWDHSMGMLENEGPAALVARKMDESQILAHVPGTSKEHPALYSVEEILEMWVLMQRGWEAAKDSGPAEMERLCAAVPCPGETQYGGKGCSGYCDVHEVSGRLMRKYGRPEALVPAAATEAAEEPVEEEEAAS